MKPIWELLSAARNRKFSGTVLQFILQTALIGAMTGIMVPANAFEFIEDSSGAYSLATVQSSPSWIESSGTPNFGWSSSVYWLKFSVRETDQILTVNNAWLGDLQISWFKQGELVNNSHTGSWLPVNTKPVDHPGFVFTIPQGDIHPDTLIVRVETNDPYYVPYQFQTYLEFQQATGQHHMLSGAYYGLLLILIAYSLAIFFGMRDVGILYYAIFAASLGIFTSTYDGFGQQYLWPDTPGIQIILERASQVFASISHVLFAYHLLRLKSHAPFLAKISRWYINVSVFFLMAMLVTGWYWLAFITAWLILMGTGLTQWFAIHRSREGDFLAKVFVYANGILIIGLALFILMLAGVLEPNWLYHRGVQIGTTLELIILSIALGGSLTQHRRSHQNLAHRSAELGRKVRDLRSEVQLSEEHRLMQKSMQQAQKHKTISQLVGGLAHDFNNILASIMGFTELSIERVTARGDMKSAKYLDEVQQAGQRGAELVKQLQLYSRGGNKSPVEVDIVEEVEAIMQLLKGSLPATVIINYTLPESPIRSVMDTSQLQQMIVNLALNSCEAMNNRGQLNIELQRREIDDSLCASCLKRFSGDFITLKIEDTGKGIVGNTHEMFTPFYTSKKVGEGSGLGLSVVHGIVHENHGHIQVSSRAEGGTRFVIHLGLNQVSNTVEIVGNRILLIDDDASVGRYLQTLLSQENYVVTRANLPTEALEKFIQEPNAFDMVITDQLMPHGTGLELASDIHDLRPDLPVILTTGNPEALSTEEIALSGVKAVFGKPLETERLLTKVRALLSIPQASNQKQ